MPKIVQFYFHKDICFFEAAMASEASGNVCFITASNTWDCIERLQDLRAKRSVNCSAVPALRRSIGCPNVSKVKKGMFDV